MIWTDKNSPSRISPRVLIPLLRRTIAQKGENAEILARLAEALRYRWMLEEAVAAYGRAEALSPKTFRAFFGFASALHGLKRDAEALDVLDRAHQSGLSGWRVFFLRATILRNLRQTEKMREALLAAIATSSTAHVAVEELLHFVAAKRDGGALLDACAALPPGYRGTPAEIAYRAIAFSMLGRFDDACEIMDLDNQVAQASFSPPAEFPSLEVFNATLSEDIAADAAPYLNVSGQIAPNLDALRCSYLGAIQTKAYPVLANWLRDVIDAELETFESKPGTGLFTNVPETGKLFTQAQIYRGAGTNGVHMHAEGIVSGVFHVQVPDDLDDKRGVLHLGLMPASLTDIEPCWPTRVIKPVPGTLTLFPSFVFHDFAPTGSTQPRIAIGVDLRPGGEDAQ